MARQSFLDQFPVSLFPAPWLGNVRVSAEFRWRQARRRLAALAPRAWRATEPDITNIGETSDGRLTAELRLALAVITVVIAGNEPTAAPLLLPVAVAYLAYASLVFFAGFDQRSLIAGLTHYYPVDAGAFLLFLALADARGLLASLFATYLFVFATVSAASTWGEAAGARLTWSTAALCAAVIVLRASLTSEFEPAGPLFSLGCLLGVGTIAARRGGYQFTARRRRALLREAGSLANPRFGVDRTIDALLERLREFFEAETCILTTGLDADVDTVTSRRTWNDGWWGVQRGDNRPGKSAAIAHSLRKLPWLPPDTAVLYVRGRRPGSSPPAYVWSAERIVGRLVEGPLPCDPEMAETLLQRIGGRSWLSVPVYADHRLIGRLHVISDRRLARSDVDFALQVMDSGMRLVENIRLVDRLASSAALRERQRVARDLHDSVIQPYIGLQFGLVAVQRILASGNLATAEAKVRRLVDLTGTAIDDLRHGVHRLKRDSAEHENELMRALRRHVARFAEDTGIQVDLEGLETVCCGDRLAAELFQMAVEALSNVRRHTASTRAHMRFHTDSRHVRLHVENLEPTNGNIAPFMPKSLSERATALGGRVTVDRYHDGRSIVEITVPL
ncbi:MAG TPA: histidine kinase [Vicinamibacterales bacterium]